MQFLMKHFTPFESTGRSVGMFGYDEWELTGDRNTITELYIIIGDPGIGKTSFATKLSKSYFIKTANTEKWWDAAARRCLQFPYSYVFRNEDNEIVSACINDVIERPKLNETGKKKRKSIQKRQVIEMDRLICTLESKMWPLVPPSITKLLKIVAIATQGKYGRHGLMHKLMTFDIAEQKRNGIQGAISKATAFKSQKLFAKLGYQVIYQINYDEWLDKDGKQIFNCDDGTNCAQLVYKSY
ncbi:Replication-associated protein [Dirofilaria immitis]|nr:Replication-associated protein [Dirofilaria immitis]